MVSQGGGNVKIESRKLEIKAAPRIEAKNDAYQPRGGDKKVSRKNIQRQWLENYWKIEKIVEEN